MAWYRRFFPVWLLLLALIVVGGYFRASGLFRGLERGVIYHPDSPKQVMMLFNYLHGNYVQYYDSLFYDGYPYGLNRVDEGLIRLTYTPYRAFRVYLNPEAYFPAIPDRQQLYLWGRVLRVLYGLVVVVLIFATIRRLGGGPLPALAAAALYAFAPLGATVSHAVTGDIGVDLFVAFAMFTAAHFIMTQRTPWLVLYGLVCGLGFSCKFQGALGIWFMAVIFLLSLWQDPKTWPSLVRKGLLLIPCFLAGMVAGTPGLMIDPENTWRNMRKNFAFIKDYGVSSEFLAQPFIVKVRYGLSHNLPEAFNFMGSIFLILAGVSLLYFLFRQLRQSKATNPTEAYLQRYALAVASFPFMALALATALKPAVQPFHFSFILPVMAVSSGCLLMHAKSWKRAPARWLVISITSFALLQSLTVSIKEDFFWRRSEASLLSTDFSRIVFGHERNAVKNMSGRRIIKQFYTEPSALPVFRNRPSGLQHDQASWWQEQHILPVPSLPWPAKGSWIFMNGPVFPINDRMFVVPASGAGMVGRIDTQPQWTDEPMMAITPTDRGRWFQRTLVYPQPPQKLHIGLRTGRWPSRYSLRIGGKTYSGFLLPHRQVILPVDSISGRCEYATEKGKPDVTLVPLAMKAQLGPLWVTMIDTPGEMSVYQMHGPHPNEANAQDYPRLPADTLTERLTTLRYLEGTNAFPVTPKPVRLVGDAAALAGGAYTLRAVVLNSSDEPRTLNLELRDLSWLPHHTPPYEQVIPPGLHHVTWSFEKEFVPYDALLFCSTATNELTMLEWQLKPDVDGLIRWSEKSHTGSNGMDQSLTAWPIDMDYPEIGRVKALLIPKTINVGEPFGYSARIDIAEHIRHKDFHEAVVFLHMKNEAGARVASLDFPLRKASMADHAIHHYPGLITEKLPPGVYTIEGGIYNIRSRIRYAFTPTTAHDANVKKRFFRWGQVIIE